MKKIILSLIFVLLMSLSFNSCSDKSEYSYNPAPQVTNAYNAAFIKTFGQPAANQDWGFDQYAYARTMTRGSGSHPDSQNWGYPKYPNTMKLEEIPSITSEEVEAVLAVFNQKYDGPCESAFNWHDFYVQHVWKGTASYTTKDGNTTVVGGEKMNWLCAYSKNGKDDQINNFKPEDGDIMLMLNSSTSRFGYKSEIDNGHVFYYYRMEKINGQWYVGFDFSAEGNNSKKQIDRDHIYNDWIIKLLPSRGYINPASVRIIAEDLSANTGTDFDFNDVVFDVNFNDGDAYCTLIAAGGTLPLRINGDDNLEVHKLFGVWKGDLNTVQEMINTVDGHRTDYAYVNFKLNGINNSTDIKIEVYKEGAWIEMTAQRGVPAAKIAVDQNFEYCNEKQPIYEKFANFNNWVQFVDYIWW